jgi:hypothetical protein
MLLLTLLTRPDLRPLVKKCHLFPEDDIQEVDLPKLDDTLTFHKTAESGRICDLLWSQTDAIKGSIQRIIQDYSFSSDFRSIWYAKTFETTPLFDGALSLLLCLTTNITDIQLDLSSRHPLPVTSYLVVDVDWIDLQDGNQDVPFAKLETLITSNTTSISQPCSAFDVAIKPGLRKLIISGNRDCHLFWPDQPPLDTNVLRVLSLGYVDIVAPGKDSTTNDSIDSG